MYNFIVNPKARSHQGIAIWKKIKNILEDKNVQYKEFMTKGPGYARKVTDKITRDRGVKPIIIVLGGDGTLNEVINGINYIENVTLGYIPIGSSNDFARGMGLNGSEEELLNVVLSNLKHEYIDYGIVRVGGESRRYVVSSGIGYDAGVCYETNYSSIKVLLNKLRLGKFTYVVIALKQLIKQPLVECKITFDDSTDIEYNKMILIATHIQKYEGGGLMFCPDADYQDGTLDMCVANNIFKPKVLQILPKAYKGEHIKFKGITTYKCTKAKVKVNRPLYVHTDGESFVLENGTIEHMEVEFANSVDKIKFIVG